MLTVIFYITTANLAAALAWVGQLPHYRRRRLIRARLID